MTGGECFLRFFVTLRMTGWQFANDKLARSKTKQDTSKTRKARLPEGSVLAVHNQGKRSLTKHYAVYSLFYKTAGLRAVLGAVKAHTSSM